jgi:hypothetical protein
MKKPAGRGLDGRHRDRDGTISRKHRNTKVGTLRKQFGEHFAEGRRSDLLLGTSRSSNSVGCCASRSDFLCPECGGSRAFAPCADCGGSGAARRRRRAAGPAATRFLAFIDETSASTNRHCAGRRRKKRTISRLASGPRGSVNEPDRLPLRQHRCRWRDRPRSVMRFMVPSRTEHKSLTGAGVPSMTAPWGLSHVMTLES